MTRDTWHGPCPAVVSATVFTKVSWNNTTVAWSCHCPVSYTHAVYSAVSGGLSRVTSHTFTWESLTIATPQTPQPSSLYVTENREFWVCHIVIIALLWKIHDLQGHCDRHSFFSGRKTLTGLGAGHEESVMQKYEGREGVRWGINHFTRVPHLRARWWNVAWGLMAIELSWAARYSCSPSDLISQHSVTSPFTAPITIRKLFPPADPVKCQTGLSVNGHHGCTMWTFLFILNFPLPVSSSGIIIGSKAMGHYYVCASVELCKNTAPWCNGVVTKCLWPGSQSPVTGGARTRGNVCK